MCPGVSTLIENLFHSFGGVSLANQMMASEAPWLKEYVHGANMEVGIIARLDIHVGNLIYCKEYQKLTHSCDLGAGVLHHSVS